jgi:hypothetical protein
MSSEPPFEHPPDHRRYAEPPPPPREMPWLLTANTKSGCGRVLGVLLFACMLLLTVCCFSVVIEDAKKHIVDSINGVGERLDRTNTKLDELNKKLEDANKKPGEPKKDDANKKEK